MIKIISGGQTGVDRAALDVACDLDFERGGWCPKGRLAEDGPLSDWYPLKETPSSEYVERTVWNVRDSDGTLILTWGPPTNGTALTQGIAESSGKPCLVVDLLENASLSAVREWVQRNRIRVLNVAGPRSSKCPGIYEDAAAFLRTLLSQSSIP